MTDEIIKCIFEVGVKSNQKLEAIQYVENLLNDSNVKVNRITACTGWLDIRYGNSDYHD